MGLTKQEAQATETALTPVYANSSALADVMAANGNGRGLQRKDLEKVTLPSGGGEFWTVIDADGSKKAVAALEGIVILKQYHRGYYEKREKSSGEGNKAPDCASEDMVKGRASTPAGPGRACEGCPMADWARVRNQWVMPCQTRLRLFFLATGEEIPFILDLPSSSIKPFEDLMTRLSLRIKKPYFQVPIKLALEAKEANGNKYSVIKPSIDIAARNDLTPQDLVTLSAWNTQWADLMKPRPARALRVVTVDEEYQAREAGAVEDGAAFDTDEIDTDAI